MLHWLAGALGQIWPNLAASGIATTLVFTWHHRKIKVTIQQAVEGDNPPTNQ
jgi:hypothetical protein